MPTAIYEVPQDASPQEQRLALVNALEISEHMQRNLEFPQSYYNGRRVSFCLMFDIHDIALKDRLVTRNSSESVMMHSIEVKDAMKAAFGRKRNATIYLRFDSLLEHSTGSDVSIFLCDPFGEAYQGMHECVRKNGDDPAFGAVLQT